MENNLLWLFACYVLVGIALLYLVVYFLNLLQLNMIIGDILNNLLPYFMEKNAEIQEYVPR